MQDKLPQSETPSHKPIEPVTLISVEEMKQHLRIDHDDDDRDIELKIAGASEMIIRYLKGGSDLFIDKEGNIHMDSIPYSVRCAVMQLVGMMYEDRDGERMKDWSHGYLPHSVTAFIYMLRKPAIK